MIGPTLTTRRNRRGFTIVAAIAIVTVLMVGNAIAKSSPYLKVSPKIVNHNAKVTLSGSVGSGCSNGEQVTIYSKAFAGATKKKFAGVPAVFTKVGSGGKFSTKVTIAGSQYVYGGTYNVAARCGGAKFGSAKLMVSISYG
jgi:hypothetical protein